jgi:hypothetical protein
LSDGTRAYLLDVSAGVPEPGTFSALLIGAGLLLRRNHRRPEKD